MKQLIPILIVCLLLASCSSEKGKNSDKKRIDSLTHKKQDFPKVQQLSNFTQTAFVPTLETEFNTKKNTIYSASLLMAWDEIKQALNTPITNIEAPILQQINNAISHKNVLAKGEFKTSVSISDSLIKAQAFFNKSLPFPFPLEKDSLGLKFQNQQVSSFSIYSYHDITEILYYHNDNDFAIRLHPKNKEHEIILMKTFFPPNGSLKTQLRQLTQKINSFKKSRNQQNDWKPVFMPDDVVRVPIISFHLENNYTDIQESTFVANKITRSIGICYQRTAFILNEKGAKVESEAEITATTDAPEGERPRPKKLFFDKPFLILLKRKKSQYPYFAMWVANGELMEKP